MWERIFDFGPIPTLVGYADTDYKGVVIFLQIDQFFIKKPEIKF